MYVTQCMSRCNYVLIGVSRTTPLPEEKQEKGREKREGRNVKARLLLTMILLDLAANEEKVRLGLPVVRLMSLFCRSRDDDVIELTEKACALVVIIE